MRIHVCGHVFAYRCGIVCHSVAVCNEPGGSVGVSLFCFVVAATVTNVVCVCYSSHPWCVPVCDECVTPSIECVA